MDTGVCCLCMNEPGAQFFCDACGPDGVIRPDAEQIIARKVQGAQEAINSINLRLYGLTRAQVLLKDEPYECDCASGTIADICGYRIDELKQELVKHVEFIRIHGK